MKYVLAFVSTITQQQLTDNPLVVNYCQFLCYLLDFVAPRVASLKGVLPKSSIALGLAPLSNKNLTVSTLPQDEAT